MKSEEKTPYKSQVTVLQKKPFDFKQIRIIIKNTNGKEDEVFLDKKWAYKNISHFKPVIDGVSDDEGIEITLSCNLQAFEWIIEYMQAEDKKEDALIKLNHENCLNIIVTANFLRLTSVYEVVWEEYFKEHFSEVINKCKLSLSGIDQKIMGDIATRVSLLSLLDLNEREDKFISNIFRIKVDQNLDLSGVFAC